MLNISEETKNRLLSVEAKIGRSNILGFTFEPNNKASDEELAQDVASFLEEFEKYIRTGKSDRFKEVDENSFKLG